MRADPRRGPRMAIFAAMMCPAALAQPPAICSSDPGVAPTPRLPDSAAPPFEPTDGLPGACYPNCDNSTTAPILNINDYMCFINKFALGDSYANCDGSSAAPVLNANDFICFHTQFLVGCP